MKNYRAKIVYAIALLIIGAQLLSIISRADILWPFSTTRNLDGYGGDSAEGLVVYELRDRRIVSA